MPIVFSTGEMDIAFLFTKDKPVAIPFEVFSYWFGFRFGLSSLALLLVMPMLKRWHVSDSLVCILGLVSKIAGLCTLAFSTSVPLIFVGKNKHAKVIVCESEE